MDILPQDNTPRKQCTKCELWFPATTTYFHKQTKGRLQPACKECRKTPKIEKPLPTRKQCAKCEEWYDATLTNFFAENKTKSGLRSICKGCCEKYNDENAESQKAYQREYTDSHADAKKVYFQRWRSTNANKKRDADRNYKVTHRDQVRQRKQLYHMAHRDTILPYLRGYYQNVVKPRKQDKPRRMHVSRFEMWVMDLIQSAGVKIETQVKKDNWIFDAAIPGTNILVEADGVFWHNLPSAIRRDMRKNAWCVAHGHQLIRIPELAFYNNPLDAITPLLILWEQTTGLKHSPVDRSKLVIRDKRQKIIQRERDW